MYAGMYLEDDPPAPCHTSGGGRCHVQLLLRLLAEQCSSAQIGLHLALMRPALRAALEVPCEFWCPAFPVCLLQHICDRPSVSCTANECKHRDEMDEVDQVTLH